MSRVRRSIVSILATAAVLVSGIVAFDAPAASAAPSASLAPASPVSPLGSKSLTATSQPAAASIVGTDFVPGNIISDELFYDAGAMNTSQIQTFLNTHISGACTNGHCLTVGRFNVDSRPQSKSDTTGGVKCEAFTGGTGLSAAEIIYRAQVACGISARVILVTLQKEQGLISKTAPTDGALRAAMGMACPDTGGCQDWASGFGNQIYLGARQLVTYKVSHFATQPGYRNILFHPDANRCGAATVNIQNYATAALYAYTPYQPNAAALANLSGTGDSCSSYGNRNFWVFFTSWFGSTHSGVPTVTANSTVGEPASYLITTDFVGDMWLHPVKPDGTGYAAPTKVGSGWGSMTAVFGAGDFNRDGKPDLLARDASGVLWRYSRDGLGGWLPRVAVASGFNGYTVMFSPGDFSGDGNTDVLARDGGGTMWLFPGNGAGGLGARYDLGIGWNNYRPSAAGDYDRDGNADLFAIDTTGKLWLYRGNGNSGAYGRVQMPSTYSDVTALLGGVDVNGDGKVDQLARDGSPAGGGQLVLLKGDGGTGVLSSTVLTPGWDQYSMITSPNIIGDSTVAVPTVEPVSTAVDDFSGDGKGDVVARDGSGAVWLFPGDDAGHLGTRAKLSGNWKGLTALFGAGDFNGDSHPDFIGRDLAGAVWLYPTTGTGWGAPVKLATGWAGYTSVFADGDFSGDGRVDVFARDSSGVLWMFPGNGSNGFGARVNLGTWSPYRASGAGDFNADGNSDLFAIETSTNKLWVYLGDGLGSATRIQVPGVWGPSTSVLGGVDLNGDGKVDILARDSSTGSMTLFAGDGAGGIAGSTVIAASGWADYSMVTSPAVLDDASVVVPTVEPLSTAVDDFSGDGKGDVLARDASGSMWLYAGDDAGHVGTRAKLSGNWKGLTALFGAGDFNGDSHPDLIGRDLSGAVWLYPTTGSGWGAPVKLATDWAGYTNLFADGDFSGDGRVDVFARDSSGILWMFPGNGSNGFGARVNLGTWTPYRASGAGDFNADGNSDLFAIETATSKLWVYLGDGHGSATRVQVPGVWGPTASVMGGVDLNGDGKVDILARDSSTGAVTLFAGDGAGGIAGSSVVAATGWAGYSMVTSPAVLDNAEVVVPTVQPLSTAVDDFSGDGKGDVVARDGSGAVWSFPGDDAGHLGTPVRLSGNWKGLTALFGAGDFNGDSHPDLIGRDLSGAMWLYPTTGTGWAAPVKLATGWAGYTSVFADSDFSGDGRVDVFARDAGGTMWMFPGNGSNGFGAKVDLGIGWNNYRASGAGDFNADGKADLFAIDGSSKLWVYLGDGHGSATRVQVPGVWGPTTTVIGGVDLNGDGRVDILARDSSSGSLTLFAGDGAGGIASTTVIAATGWAGYPMVFSPSAG